MTDAAELDRLRAENADLRRRLRAAEAALAAGGADGRAGDRLQAVDACVACAPVGLAVVDREFRYVHINDALAELNGRPAADHTGRTVPEILPGIWPDLEPVFRRVLDRGEAVLGLEVAGTSAWRPGRGPLTCLASFFPVRGPDGAVTGAGVAVLDITDRKRAEEALARYRLLSEQNRDIILLLCPGDGRIVEANAAAEAAYGYSRAELLARTIADLRAPDTLADMHDQLARAECTGALFETRHRRRDGSTFPVEVSSRGASIGGQWLLLSAVRDVTARKAAEDRLRATDERLQLAREAAGLGIYDYDLSTGLINWDARVRELWGAGPDEPITYDTFLGGLHPDDVAATRAAVDRAVDPAGDGAYRAEYRVLHRADGAARWVLATGRTYFRGGRAVRLVGVAQDVTERKRAEGALVEAKRFTDQIIGLVPNIIYVRELATGHNVFANRHTAEALGYTPADVVNLGADLLPTLLHPDDLAGRPARDARLYHLRDGQVDEIEYRVRHRYGGWRWFVSRDAVFRRGPDGRPTHIIGVATA